MKISIHRTAMDTFVPMLESLSSVLDKGAAHEKSTRLNLVTARLAPDMYTLAQQVQQACHYASDAVSRLAGSPASEMGEVETTFSGLNGQIARTLDVLREISAHALDGAEDRDCSIELGDDKIIDMDGLRFLVGWSLPHFYFHVVTAYDILRHGGVVIGKNDYLSQVGGFIRSKVA